jgi:hypothetical protein
LPSSENNFMASISLVECSVTNKRLFPVAQTVATILLCPL